MYAMTEDEYSSDSDWGDHVSENWRKELPLLNNKPKIHVGFQQQRITSSKSEIDQSSTTLPSASHIQKNKSTVDKLEHVDVVNNTEHEVEIDVEGLDERMQDNNIGSNNFIPSSEPKDATQDQSSTAPSHTVCTTVMKGYRKIKRNTTKKILRRSKRLRRLEKDEMNIKECQKQPKRSTFKRTRLQKMVNAKTARHLDNVVPTMSRSITNGNPPQLIQNDDNLDHQTETNQSFRFEFMGSNEIVKQLKDRICTLEREKDALVLELEAIKFRGEVFERQVNELTSKLCEAFADFGVFDFSCPAVESDVAHETHNGDPLVINKSTTARAFGTSTVERNIVMPQAQISTSLQRDSQSTASGTVKESRIDETRSYESAALTDPLISSNKLTISNPMWKCQVCKLEFHMKQSLTNHAKIHKREKAILLHS